MGSGDVPTGSLTAQLRSSYLPSEILWGHHLSPLVTYQKTDGHYRIDYAQFHSVVPIEPAMSEKSACKLHDRSKQTNRSLSNSSDQTEPSYPVNFTAPTPGQRQKKAWSLRRGSLKGSLRRKGSDKPKSPPSNGMSKFITPAGAALPPPYGNPQSTVTSLQSVLEAQDDQNIGRAPAASCVTQAPVHNSNSASARSSMKRSKSSPEHCVLADSKEQLQSSEASNADF